MLVRFGLLAALVGNVVNIVLWIPIPSNLSAWYAGPALFAIVDVAAVATYGFHCALGGRSAFESVLARE